jgi:hypothetical protein
MAHGWEGDMQGHRFLGIAMVLAGAMLMWMVVAATTVTQVQLDDPLVGHLARNSIWYAATAMVVGLLGGVVFFRGAGTARRSRALLLGTPIDISLSNLQK